MKLRTKKHYDDYRNWDIGYRLKNAERRLKPFLKRRLSKARRAEVKAFIRGDGKSGGQ